MIESVSSWAWQDKTRRRSPTSAQHRDHRCGAEHWMNGIEMFKRVHHRGGSMYHRQSVFHADIRTRNMTCLYASSLPISSPLAYLHLELLTQFLISTTYHLTTFHSSSMFLPSHPSPTSSSSPQESSHPSSSVKSPV